MHKEPAAFLTDVEPPRVSVLMAVHNGARYLPEALRSILGQSFENFEFLIVDDGSTDASPGILIRAARQDPRIRLIFRPQRGLATSLNELLGEAQGEFLARMDADDIALPERLALQVDFLVRNPEVVCVGGASMMIDDAGRYLTTLYPPETDQEVQAAALAGHTPINHPTAMMRRGAVRVVGGYDGSYPVAQDLDLWLRLGEIGALANLAVPVLKYRLHGKSLSEQAAGRQDEARRRACEAAWKRRGITGRFEGQAAWRPGKDSLSRCRFMTRYGWWAWNSGERRTALYYSWRAVCANPLDPAGWRLLLTAAARPGKPESGRTCP